MNIEKSTYEHLLACETRLVHLLQSDFIASFDEVDLCKHKYKRDIAEADNIAKAGESIMQLQKNAEETRNKMADAFRTASESIKKSLNAYKGLSMNIAAAGNEAEKETMCRYYRECFGACDWCKTHDYSEACVPMLQAEAKRQTQKANEYSTFILKTVLTAKENKNADN